MKKLLIALLSFPTFSYAGTMTWDFSPLGQIIISSGTAVASASIAFDSSTTKEQSGPNRSVRWTQNCNGCSMVAVGAAINSGSVSITSVTIDNGSLTLANATGNASGPNRAEMWVSTFTPTSGSLTVEVNLSAAAQAGFVAYTFTGTKVASDVIDVSSGTTAGGGTAIVSSSFTTTTDGSWCVDIVFQNNEPATFNTAAGQTQRYAWNQDNGFFAWVSSTRGPIATAGASYMTQGISTSFSQPSQSVVCFKKEP